MFKKIIVGLIFFVFTAWFTYSASSEYERALSEYNNAQTKLRNARAYRQNIGNDEQNPPSQAELDLAEKNAKDAMNAFNAVAAKNREILSKWAPKSTTEEKPVSEWKAPTSVIKDDKSNIEEPIKTNSESTTTWDSSDTESTTSWNNKDSWASTPESTKWWTEKEPKEAHSKLPRVNCIWLPGCVDKDIDKPTAASTTKNLGI